MDNYDFFNTIISAIATNSAIATWCSTNFGSGTSLKVFVDVTSNDLPDIDDMPYAIIHTPGVSKHQERRDQIYTVAVDIAINKDALTTKFATNVHQPAGVELILDLGTLVAEAVKAALPANTAMGYDLSADTLGALPEVHAYMDFDFITHVSLAGDPLA